MPAKHASHATQHTERGAYALPASEIMQVSELATPHRTTPHPTRPHCTTRHRTAPCRTMLHQSVPHRTTALPDGSVCTTSACEWSACGVAACDAGSNGIAPACSSCNKDGYSGTSVWHADSGAWSSCSFECNAMTTQISVGSCEQCTGQSGRVARSLCTFASYHASVGPRVNNGTCDPCRAWKLGTDLSLCANHCRPC